MVSQSDQIRGCYKEMLNQLKKLKDGDDITFREYIGYEMAVNKFYERFERVLKDNLTSNGSLS